MLKQVLAVLVLAGMIEGASIEKAKMLNTHGLKDAAKQELIDVIYGASGAEAKADAYYYLGNIAWTERKVTEAISTWNELVKKYPNSKRVVEVQQQIEGLKAVLDDTLAVVSENVTANIYLQYAEYWWLSYSPPHISTIGLPDEIYEGAGLKWVDKIIAEFPGTDEAEQAYKRKLIFFLEKAKSKADDIANKVRSQERLQRFREGDFSRVSGIDELKKRRNSQLEAIRESDEVKNAMSKVIALFDEFEAAFPNSTFLQRFRFGIAQFYMEKEGFGVSDQWFNKIIEEEGDGDSLYKQIAQYRLKFRSKYLTDPSPTPATSP